MAEARKEMRVKLQGTLAGTGETNNVEENPEGETDNEVPEEKGALLSTNPFGNQIAKNSQTKSFQEARWGITLKAKDPT